MGEELKRKPDGTPAENQRGTDSRGTGTDRPGTRAEQNPGASASRTGTDARAGADRPGTGTQKEPSKKPDGLPILKEAPPVPAEPKKKQRRKPKKKEPEPSFNAEQISALIMTASGIIASRPGMEIWALRPEEANQLSAPIANMVEKSEKLKNMGEYADAIALVTASLMIFAPRAVVYADQQKKKKIARNGGVQLVDTRKQKPRGNDQKGEGGRSAGKPDGHDAAHAPVDGTSIFDSIPGTI